jgi:hypothetical protein
VLRKHPLSSAAIAKEISEVLRRNEETRIDHWHAKTKAFPPRRSTSGFIKVLQEN